MEWEDYFYEGTTVLKNKAGIKNQKELDVFEKRSTAKRLNELSENPIQGNFDYQHLKDIHKHLFQDVYEWAGEKREVNFNKDDKHSKIEHLRSFIEHDKIEQKATEIFTDLKAKDNLYQLRFFFCLNSSSSSFRHYKKRNP